MRVVSLLPSATELLYELGVEPVGVSHSCDYPSAARDARVVTDSRVEHGPDRTSRAIDRQVAEIEGATYDLDLEALRDLDPDLVVTQATCEVCAVDASDVYAAVEALPFDAAVLTLDPHSLEEVLAAIERVGTATGREAAAEDLVAALRDRIDRVTERAGAAAARPTVSVLDWTDPPFVSGHWVPGLIERAGGTPALVDEGPSRRVRWADVRDADPDVLVVAPCGFDLDRAADAAAALGTRDGWAELTAVREGRVYAVDGNGHVNRPGPRLVDSLEALAACVHPDRFDAPPGVVRRIEAGALVD